MSTTHRVLVPFELPDADPVPPALVETLTAMEVVVLGHYGLPEQTPPSAGRDQFETDATDELEELAGPFESAGVPVTTRLVFGKARDKTVDRVALEEGCDVILTPGRDRPARRGRRRQRPYQPTTFQGRGHRPQHRRSRGDVRPPRARRDGAVPTRPDPRDRPGAGNREHGGAGVRRAEHGGVGELRTVGGSVVRSKPRTRSCHRARADRVNEMPHNFWTTHPTGGSPVATSGGVVG